MTLQTWHLNLTRTMADVMADEKEADRLQRRVASERLRRRQATAIQLRGVVNGKFPYAGMDRSEVGK